MSIAEPIFGVDIHPQYQEGFNFDAALARGYKFAFLKTSEGPYRDGTVLPLPNFQQFANQAKASGILTGYYHYLVQGHATDSVSSARMQVDHFLRRVSNAGGIDGRLLMVDFEPYNEPFSYLTPTNAVLEAFIESLRKRVGEHPIVLYSGPGFWNGGEPSGSFSRYGADVAWTAQYLDMDIHTDPQDYYRDNKDYDGGPNFDSPWGEPWGDVQPWFWQFTAAGRVAGMNIDVNAYRGTEEELRALTAGRMLPAPDEGGVVAGDLPAGTPREILPAMGDREGWAERTWRVVREVENTFGVVCSTYNNHGTTGRSLGIDIWVAPFRQKANAAQEALGDKIQKWVEANMGRLGINYIIWWNFMRYHNGPWFDYSPYSKPASLGGFPFGDPDQQTRRHEDHVHLQIL